MTQRWHWCNMYSVIFHTYSFFIFSENLELLYLLNVYEMKIHSNSKKLYTWKERGETLCEVMFEITSIFQECLMMLVFHFKTWRYNLYSLNREQCSVSLLDHLFSSYFAFCYKMPLCYFHRMVPGSKLLPADILALCGLILTLTPPPHHPPLNKKMKTPPQDSSPTECICNLCSEAAAIQEKNPSLRIWEGGGSYLECTGFMLSDTPVWLSFQLRFRCSPTCSLKCKG